MTDNQYSVKTEEITVVEGVEVDIEIRELPDGTKDRCDKVLWELKDHLGLIGQAYDEQTPPDDIEERDEGKVPFVTVNWESMFDE